MQNFIKSILILIFFLSSNSKAQIGIGTTNPHESSILDVQSENKGFLPPRLTTQERDNIQDPANGLLIYNYTTHCLEINNGTPAIVDWFNFCTSLTSNGTSAISNFDCNTNSSGVLTHNQVVSGVTQTVTVDITTTGTFNISTDEVNGVTFSGSGTFNTTGPQTITLTATGTPTATGSFDYTINTTPNCSFTRSVASTLNMLSLASFSIGTQQHFQFFNQLTNNTNYSATGTYNRITNYNFDVQSSVSFIDNLSSADLINSYDVISVGYSELNAAQALKIKQYVDAGGLLLALYDSGVGGNLNAQFSGISPVVSIPGGQINTNSNNHEILNGVFGDGRNSTISGAGSYGKFLSADIPSGSIILATNGVDYGIWTRDFGQGRAMFFWDEGAFRNSAINGNIDNAQERALHNCLTYLFNKKF